MNLVVRKKIHTVRKKIHTYVCIDVYFLTQERSCFLAIIIISHLKMDLGDTNFINNFTKMLYAILIFMYMFCGLKFMYSLETTKCKTSDIIIYTRLEN